MTVAPLSALACVITVAREHGDEDEQLVPAPVGLANSVAVVAAPAVRPSSVEPASPAPATRAADTNPRSANRFRRRMVFLP